MRRRGTHACSISLLDAISDGLLLAEMSSLEDKSGFQSWSSFRVLALGRNTGIT